GSRAGVVEVERSVTAVLGQDVVLPCRYRAQEQEQVVQVTWLKRGPGGHSAKLAVLDLQHGEHVQEPYAGRGVVGTGQSDGRGRMGWARWSGGHGSQQVQRLQVPTPVPPTVPPLPILNPGPPLEEGQGRTLAASCTAEGNPVPSVHWETEVRGTNATRRSAHARSASVTSEFFLVPGRSMNGKSLTCVVAHPGLRHEKRITHQLSVACALPGTVGHWGTLGGTGGHSGHWGHGGGIGKEGTAGTRGVGMWRMLNAPLPAGVRVKGDTLVFQRPLAAADAGAYVCRVANRVAAKEARANVSIRGREPDDEVRKVDLVSASVVVVGVIAAVLLCVLVVVVVVMTLYHRRKTKRISEKYEEELTLTRENSIRRLHSSHSADARAQLEETLQLRAESRQGSLRGDSLRGDSLRGTSICSAMVRAHRWHWWGTGVTDGVRRSCIQPRASHPRPPEHSPQYPGGESLVSSDPQPGGDPIKQAMTHFVQENGMLQAKPSTNGIYINGRGHLV
ncbi:NECT4 protein, partial [Indicator maculatus]|nr:NECT4 protein [Indicator maculatus]